MADLPGDATPEDADKAALAALKAQIASSSPTNLVTLTTEQALRIFDMAGGSMEQDEEEQKAVAGPTSYAEFAERQYPPEDEEAKAKTAAATPQQQAAAPAKRTRAQLNEMTKEELVNLADDEDIEVSTSWTKGDIVDAILKAK